MAHSHVHSHQHNSPHQKAFIIGIALNTAFVIAEIVYGLKANSLALLADAGHNASDVLGLLMAFGATLLSKRLPTERFTYGLQSSSIMAALVNAVLLLVAVGGIGLEAIQRFSNPEAVASSTVMLVAGIGVIINGISAALFFSDRKKDLNIRGAFMHMAVDAAISLGVVISALLISFSGWLWIDPMVSLTICLIIIAGTWGLLKDSLNLSLHAVPNHIDISDVKRYLASLSGVSQVHDLHIWAMSTTETALSVHLVMPSGHPGDEFITEICNHLHELFEISHSTIQIELGDSSVNCHHAPEFIV
jgi:cobalt-zinc-cadmium efflux system protein